MKYLNQFYSNLHGEILKLCHSLKLKPHNFIRGSKLFNNYQRVAILILYIRSGKSLRIFCKEFVETKWSFWLQLRKCPKKSTLHDWFKSFSTTFIRKIFEFTISDLKPKIVAIDGSGIDTQYQSRYYQKRLDDFGFRKPKSPWHKLDIIVDIESKEKFILDFSFLLYPRHDSKVAWQLFSRFKFRNVFVLADKAYWWFKLFKLLKSQNNILVVPPKKYKSKIPTHSKAVRTQIKTAFYENEDLYSLRNNVEGAFSSLKRVQKLHLRSKLHFMKKREMAWNIVWYNIRKKLSSHIIFIMKIIRLQLIIRSFDKIFANIYKLINFNNIKY